MIDIREEMSAEERAAFDELDDQLRNLTGKTEATHDALNEVANELSNLTAKRAEARYRVTEFEDNLADVEKSYTAALKKGTRPPQSMSAAKAKLTDGIAEAQAIDRVLPELAGEKAVAEKVAKEAADAEHDVAFAKLYLAYHFAKRALIRDFYRPLLESFLEDSRRLPTTFCPFFDDSAMDHEWSHIQAFLNRNPKPPQLPKGLTTVKFTTAWPGSSRNSSIGHTCSYGVDEIAAFPKATAAELIKAGVACAL